MEKILTLSVHQLVDFLLRSGDIDNRTFNRTTMQEGSRLHSEYQSSQNSDYFSEYPLRHDFVVDGAYITLEGRADGILKRKNGDYVIDEVKTSVTDIHEFRDNNIEWHLGQAKCYAYMFAIEQNLDFVGVRLTYIQQGNTKNKFKEEYLYTQAELEQYVTSLLEDYLSFYNIVFVKLEERTKSAEDIIFPFDKFRKGQREVAKKVYLGTQSGGRLFVEAPTGIGKTMSMLFPYIKALKDDEKSKIFYLTAKGSGKESAYNAVEILKTKGLKINDIVVTAKDKICFCPEKNCNPDECPFAQGYYSKIQSILKLSLLQHSTFDLKTITRIAKEYQICPFEFELDLSLFCDVIICDYNYLFDPISYMKRYFDEDASHFMILIDEAHNLIDRGRSMYSASLSQYTLLSAKKSLRSIDDKAMKNRLSKLTKLFESYVEQVPEGYSLIPELDEEQDKILDSFCKKFLEKNKDDYEKITKELTELFREVNRFIKIKEFVDDSYIYYIEKKDGIVTIHLSCLNPSEFLKMKTNKVKSSVFFSATLSPMNYYIDSLGGNYLEDIHLSLPSPFLKRNLKIMIAPKVSIKYKNRDSSISDVVEYIKAFISPKIGNYFIYSPSYEYMHKILDNLTLDDNIDVYIQEKDMTEFEKSEFLLNFKEEPSKTTIGFLVLGGAFSEGIDLVSDRLIGAVIIGIGMPKINFESDHIAEYFNKIEKPGFEYAYLNPGMNKVQQAVGRVIRSENDIGSVLLIDERYMYRQYKDLFRDEWENYDVVYSPSEVSKNLVLFYKNN